MTSLYFHYLGIKFGLAFSWNHCLLWDETNDEYVWSWKWTWFDFKFAWEIMTEHADTKVNWNGTMISLREDTN